MQKWLPPHTILYSGKQLKQKANGSFERGLGDARLSWTLWPSSQSVLQGLSQPSSQDTRRQGLTAHPGGGNGLLLHKSHRCRHHFCVGSRGSHLSPCRTWRKKTQSFQPCSRVCIDLPLGAEREKEDLVKTGRCAKQHGHQREQLNQPERLL